MEKIVIKEIDEVVYKKVLDNGLTCYFYPKDYHKAFFMLGFKYGGSNNHFKSKGKGYEFPTGVAHFLEHTIFTYRGEDVLNTLADFGASANAFTTHFETMYFFHTAFEYQEALRVFIDFLFRRDLEIIDLQGEKEIIAQEVAMHASEPLEEVTQKLLDSLFFNYPVKLPILGLPNDINKIDGEMIRMAYRAFYHPENAVFIASGRMDIDSILSMLNTIPSYDKYDTVPVYPQEPCEAKDTYVITKIHSETTYVLMGVKLASLSYSIREYELIMEAVCFILFSKASLWTNELIEQGLIFDEIGIYLDINEHVKYFTLTFIANDYSGLVGKLNELFNCIEDYLDEELYTEFIKSTYGREIPFWDNLEEVALELADEHFSDTKLEDFFERFKNIRFSDVLKAGKALQRENATIIVGLPEDN